MLDIAFPELAACAEEQLLAHKMGLCMDERHHVLRHLGVRHGLAPGRRAVVARIRQVDPMPVAERSGDPRPVASGTEQPVQDHQGRAVAHGLECELNSHGIPAQAERWRGACSRVPSPFMWGPHSRV